MTAVTSPAAPPRPGTRSQRRPLRARRATGLLRSQSGRALLTELVAGAADSWGARAAHALPHPFDDLTEDWGVDIYAEMLLDPQVESCITILKASILEDGLQLAPAIQDQEDRQYQQAVEIRDQAVRMLERLTTPLDDVLWSMLDALSFGNKVAEIVSELQDVDGKQFAQIVAIKPKPREVILFVVDAYLNLLGFLGAKPGQATPAIGGGMLLFPESTVILPRDKFAVLTIRPVDGDPRGTSLLRAAYEPWWRKRQLDPEHLKYLSQFAVPSLWATPPDDDPATAETDDLGNPDPAADPDEEPLTPADELLALLLAFRNATALVVAPGTEIHTIEMQGDGEPFLKATGRCDQQITKAILTQSLATEAGEHQARAASETHQDVLDTLVRQLKRAVVRMMSEDVLRPWVERNYGAPSADLLTPILTLGTTERADQPQMMTAVAGLMRANYFHPSQMPAVDELLGLPVRDMTQAPQPMPASNPAPGEPSAPNQGQQQGQGTPEPAGTPSPPSGPAERGGRGRQPAQNREAA